MKSLLLLFIGSWFLFLAPPARGGEIGVKYQLQSAKALPEASTAPQEAASVSYADLIGNDYYAGQCVWFVANELKVPAGMGNAIEWYDSAAALHIPEGTTPKVGAVAWTNTYYLGHVAVVTAVYPDGTFEIKEMNYKGPFKTDSRTVTDLDNWRFIYVAP